MKNKLAAQLIAAALAMGTVFSGSVVYAAPTATTPYRTLVEHVETSTRDDLLTAEAVDLYVKGGVPTLWSGCTQLFLAGSLIRRESRSGSMR